MNITVPTPYPVSQFPTPLPTKVPTPAPFLLPFWKELTDTDEV